AASGKGAPDSFSRLIGSSQSVWTGTTASAGVILRRYTLSAAKLLTHAAKQQRCAASAAPLFGLHLYGKRG
ncbi:hypothetical protein BHE74_00018542, partial [Ensete ventricosum]